MKSTDLRDRDQFPASTWLNIACNRRVAVQRQVRPRTMIVVEIRLKNAFEVTLVEDDDVLDALSANRTDDALNVRTLPRRTERNDDFLDAHVLDPLSEVSIYRSAFQDIVTSDEVQTPEAPESAPTFRRKV